MSNSGHKYVYSREKTDDYAVSITRKRDRFFRAFNTLEEAINIRDRVLQFYEEFSRIPSAKEIGLKRREHRLQTDSHNERHISLDETCGKRPYRVLIVKNRVSFVKNFSTLEEAIKTRDEVLDFFKEFDRLPNREEQETLFGVKFKDLKNLSDKKDSKSNTSKKNITFDKSFNRYAIQITRKGMKFYAVNQSLEEAIELRDEVLEFYRLYDRLPSKTEYQASLKKGTLL